MPRITETLELGTLTYKAVRPQNGATPAQYRQSGVPLVTASDMNLGVQITKTANRAVRRAKVSMTFPVYNSEGVLLYTDRVDLTVRTDAMTEAADIATRVSALGALVSADEFVAVISGDELY